MGVVAVSDVLKTVIIYQGQNFRSTVLTAMMVFVMAYSITLYNIALEKGALRLYMLSLAVKGMRSVLCCFAVVYEWLVAEYIAVKLVFYIFHHSCGHVAGTIFMAVVMLR